MLAALLLTQLAAFAPKARRRQTVKIKSESDGRLLAVKAREAELRARLKRVQREKAEVLAKRRLKIGIVGFGRFGQFLSTKFASYDHEIYGLSRLIEQVKQAKCGAKGCGRLDSSDDVEAFFERKPDVVVLACSIVSFEETLRDSDHHYKSTRNVVCRCPLGQGARSRSFAEAPPRETGVLCTHPMFGPIPRSPAGRTWPLCMTKYEYLMNTSDACERFLSLFESAGCRMVEMSCTQHDVYAANSQFLTHLVGRMLGSVGDLRSTPIDTKGFASILQVVETA